MSLRVSPKLGAYLGLAGLGLLGGLLTGRSELVALAAPFLIAIWLGLALARRPEVSLRLAAERERALEGEDLKVELELVPAASIPRLDVQLELPRELASREPEGRVVIHLPGARRLQRALHCRRWGVHELGSVHLRAADRFGFLFHEATLERRIPIRVYPRPEAVRSLLQPLETQVYAGNEVARSRGDGIEFADIRAFVPGDRVRRVNWRASARRRELHVNDLHPERNADLVIFLDTFSELRGSGRSSLDLAVRAAAALAIRYLERRDRVGLIGFGGTLRWLLPAMGLRQLYRIVDALLDTEIALSYAWKGIEVIPVRTLPPEALLVALSPLLDERAVTALLDLRGRGFDLAVVEVSPLPFVQPGRTEVEKLAYSLWRMEREALRHRYQRLGVPVAVWDEEAPLPVALEEVRTFRRYARHYRA